MKTLCDIIMQANQIYKNRDLQAQIDHELPLPDPIKFEKSFNEIFAGDEMPVKPKISQQEQDMIDAGHKYSDF